MGHVEELSPEEEPRPEALSDQVGHAADVIVHELETADDGTRHELLQTVAQRLLSQDVVVVDAHNLLPHADPLHGERGKQTGRTRDRVLTELRIIQLLGLRRRARRDKL